MQATAVVYLALLLLVSAGFAADVAEEAEEPVEDLVTTLGPEEPAETEAEAVGAELKTSRLGAKVATRSRFPAGMVGYSRYYPSYRPDYYYYYQQPYPRYPAYTYPDYYPTAPVNYPTGSVYPTNMNYPSGYPNMNYPSGYSNMNYPSGYPVYDYIPYGSGINEYSARHERA